MFHIFQKLESLGVHPIGHSKFPTQREDLDLLQKTFGYQFPTAYSEFVVRYGISGFDNCIVFPVPDSWNEQTDYSPNDIRVFYAIDKVDLYAEASTWDLRFEINNAKIDGLPNYFLPIGESDGLATVVYISCQEQNYGQIYALTRTQIWDKMNGLITTQEVSESAFHIADSFEGFIESLTIVES